MMADRLALTGSMAGGPLMSGTRQARRPMFYPKTDPPLCDERLRAIKQRGAAIAAERLPEVAAAAAAVGFPGPVRLIAVGTYHAVYRIAVAAPAAVIRIALPGLFTEDRSLLTDGWAREWLRNVAVANLVPQTHAVHFASEGFPFDFAVAAAAAGTPLDDATLDRQPEYLRLIGAVLRQVNETEGQGAGLVDIESDRPGHRPAGVHDTWSDYLHTRLDDHIAGCVRAGFIDTSLATRIRRLFAAMAPCLSDRPMRLLHGDPATHNLFIDRAARRVTALLDWEDALIGDPLFDAAMWSTFHPPRRMPDFLAGYGLASPTREEERLIALYFLRIALSKSIHRARFGIADQPGRTPGHLRILRGTDALERLR